MQQRFVSDVSHELRTPLTTIRMAGEVMYDARGRLRARPRPQSAELLQTQLDRFEALLADLLEISRFDAGAAALDPEAVDLRESWTGSSSDLAPLADRRGSRSSSSPEPAPRGRGRPPPGRADPAQPGGQRPRALRGPAGRGAPGRRRRCRRGRRPRPRRRAARGRPGMVFNRFWRADPARARTTGGTGLGLAIALEDARLHGGWLQVWGEPQEGANFRLTLPRRAGAALAGVPVAAGARGRRPRRGGRRRRGHQRRDGRRGRRRRRAGPRPRRRRCGRRGGGAGGADVRRPSPLAALGVCWRW